MTPAELLAAYARARRHMGTATWSALLALSTEPDRWHSRRELGTKMTWLSQPSAQNFTFWKAMLDPAAYIGAVEVRQGVKGRAPNGQLVPTRYRITPRGLALLGL